VHLDQLTRLRRSSFDWELRALCLLQQRDLTATINALETAIGIDPNLLLARNLLVQLYEGQRQFELANTQKQIIRRLDQFLQKN
jgi:Tfp pilus assembly protein PilF